MPRNFMFTKEEIVNAALDLTREKGFHAVTARAIGTKLGTSHRPVFGYFDSTVTLLSNSNKIYVCRLQQAGGTKIISAPNQ